MSKLNWRSALQKGSYAGSPIRKKPSRLRIRHNVSKYALRAQIGRAGWGNPARKKLGVDCFLADALTVARNAQRAILVVYDVIVRSRRPY
jgi:hypothetical protein